MKNAKDKKGGLHQTLDTAEIFDPWGNPYYVLFNYDFDDELKDPFSEDIHFATEVLVWSPGPDGKTGTPETNEDNICSWK